MTYLLDTHIWRQAVAGPDELPPDVRELLADTSTALHVSPISGWELVLLAEKGRITLRATLEAMRQVLDITEVPVSMEVAGVSRSVRLPHQDPADRFIVATAVVHGLTLVTADRVLIDHAAGQYDVLPAG